MNTLAYFISKTFSNPDHFIMIHFNAKLCKSKKIAKIGISSEPVLIIDSGNLGPAPKGMEDSKINFLHTSNDSLYTIDQSKTKICPRVLALNPLK